MELLRNRESGPDVLKVKIAVSTNVPELFLNVAFMVWVPAERVERVTMVV